jgi:hypothetical protein
LQRTSGGEVEHYPVEVEPSIVAEKSAVLVVDDVIARGSVAEKTIAKVRERLQREGISKVPVIHLALFRLGELPLPTLEDTTFISLCHVRDVYYAEDAEKCRMCRDGAPWRMEWDSHL